MAKADPPRSAPKEGSDTLKPLLTRDEAADLLHVSSRTVRRIIGRGELPALHVGNQVRIERDSLLAYIRSRLRKG